MFRLWGKMMKENRMLREDVYKRQTQGGLVVDDLVKKFNEENDHIEVVAKYNPDMYKGLMQNLQAEAATGNTPALVQIGWAFLDYFSNNFDYVAPQDAIDKFDSEEDVYKRQAEARVEGKAV